MLDQLETVLVTFPGAAAEPTTIIRNDHDVPGYVVVLTRSVTIAQLLTKEIPMPRTVIILNNPIFKLADTEAGLTAGDGLRVPTHVGDRSPRNPQFNTIPATGCAPALAVAGPDRLATRPGMAAGLDGSRPVASPATPSPTTRPKWFSASRSTPSRIRRSSPRARCYVVAGGYGGTFGDGSAAAATATWPLLDKPEIALPTTLMATQAMATETTVAGQPVESQPVAPQPQPV